MPLQTQAVTFDIASAHNQITCTTAGTRVQGNDVKLSNGVYIKALSTNSGSVYVGGSGVTSSNGFELTAGDIIQLPASNLADLWFVGTVDGDKICYFRA